MSVYICISASCKNIEYRPYRHTQEPETHDGCDDVRIYNVSRKKKALTVPQK